MAITGVTNSEGGGASFGRSEIALATSEGFFGRYAGTSHSIGVAVLAGEGTAMERDYDSVSARHAADLETAESIGRRAGERTVARLNPRKVKSQAVPVVFDPRVCLRPARAFRRRDLGCRDRARRQLPQGQHGRGSVRAEESRSSTIRIGRAACAPSPSTAKASPTRAWR